MSVRSDPTPEIEERYTLELITVTTISDVISPSGAADFDPRGTTSSITIRASNNPHGVIQFQQSSLSARAQDGTSVQFTIIREFGTFGKSATTQCLLTKERERATWNQCTGICHSSSNLSFFLLGTIRVVYTPRAGSRTALTPGQSLATPGADFVSLPMEVILEDMQQSAVISVDVLEVRIIMYIILIS